MHTATMAWVPSPAAGVDRKLLDRVGEEVARATSVVRYAPGCSFPVHQHAAGEEFLVLEGVFQDEHGDYPQGTYVRNPPGTAHASRADNGCTILVKLRQFATTDLTPVRRTLGAFDERWIGANPQRTRTSLHEVDGEHVAVERWDAKSNVALDTSGGTEVFVLRGTFEQGGEMFEAGSWLRLPPSTQESVNVGDSGAIVWIKSGHLLEPLGLPSLRTADPTL
jgi:anti-sigma factor ChrR (cupin superfamily)